MLLNNCTETNMQLTTNSLWPLFPDKIFSPTLPWLLVKSQTFPWQLSKSLTFPGFRDNWSPCRWKATLSSKRNRLCSDHINIDKCSHLKFDAINGNIPLPICCYFHTELNVTVDYNYHLQIHIVTDYITSSFTSFLQPSNYSRFRLQISVGEPSATALLQHGIPFLHPSKIVRPYIVSSTT